MDDLRLLVATEAIKRLKARYVRAVDTKDWDLLASTFAPDARSVYNDGNFASEGRDDILRFLKAALDTKDVVTMHHAHTPEIDITSETTARGTWYLEDTVLNLMESTEHMPGKSILIGTGIYHDEYVNRDGEWLISLTGYERIFEYTTPSHEAGVLRTRWNRSI